MAALYLAPCSLLIVFATTTCVVGSHFRGGVIMVRPEPGGEQSKMVVFFHVSWRRSHGPQGYCDQSIVDNADLIGTGNLTCQYGCSGTIASMKYRCTDYSTVEDWSFGENRFTYVLNGEPTIVIGFTGDTWISPFDSSWNISTKFSTRVRNDTGRINSSPQTIAAPVLRLQSDCNHVIRIPVYDPDNDYIRCRWAKEPECGGICDAFPGASLDSATCTISYQANRGLGYKVAAVMIEDFLSESDTPLSSVALQFLVFVFQRIRRCSAIPRFIPPTITSHGACVAVPPGKSFHTRLVVDSGSSSDAINEIQTVSPAGTEKSELFNIKQSNIYYVNISWTPANHQKRATHLFCYTATNTAGLSSSQTCIELLAGYNAPSPILETATPNQQAIHPFNTTWQISFNKNISRPIITAYITFNEPKSNAEVYRIDSSKSTEVTFVNGNQILIQPSFSFSERKEFYILLRRGVVRGQDACRPGNEPITNKSYWVFETLDVTPPNINFVVSPLVSNANIYLAWKSNEAVVWKCKLITGLQQIEVNCSNGSWRGIHLSDGAYQLSVSGTDTAGNMAQAVHMFTIDLNPPIVSIIRKPDIFSNQKNYNFYFTCNEICTFKCHFVDSKSINIVSSSCNFNRYTTPTLSHNHQYTFSVTATDQVGNIGRSVNYTWQTDFENPLVFGVTNTSAYCTGDTSPVHTVRAGAVDNATTVVRVTYRDYITRCFIRRTWRATDAAGNVGSLSQLITLEFTPSLNFLPLLSLSCDSSKEVINVPTNTATLQNPCYRPLQLMYQDTVGNYTCPVSFTRTWTITDTCNRKTAQFDQRIFLLDVCPSIACARNETPPHGVCIRGSCSCNKPWYGDNCQTLIYTLQVEPVNDRILKETENYKENLVLLQGTPPLTWKLISAPNRMVLSQVTGEITWRISQAGNYTIIVEVTNQVGQATVTWNVNVEPGYTAFLDRVVQVVFKVATPQQLSGRVEYTDGNVVKDFLAGRVPVSIDIITQNLRREIKTFTKSDGTFSAVFYPAGTEYGSYSAGARHPSTLKATQQTQWDVLGMKANPRVVYLRSATVAEFKETFHNATLLTNDGPRALNGVTVTPSLGGIKDVNVVLKLNGPTVLQPGDSVYVDIEIHTSGAIDLYFPITIETREGIKFYVSVDIRIAQILPHLVIEPASINARIVRGTFKTFEFNVSNVGSIAAHNVSAVLPMTDVISFVSFGNSQQQGDLILESGGSALLSILVNIPPNQPLGDISGQIVITSVETIQRISLNLIVSSDALMNLTVKVEDEYTYFADGRPLVNDARVRLVNYDRGIKITLTTEEENGTVTFINIPEDRYELFVSAPNHVAVNQIILTSPENPEYTVFLARQAVKYTWSVTPTTFEETYTITLEADFVTHVPIPVVTITPRELSLEPYELGYEDTIQYNITNHGLIRADDVQFELPSGHPFLEFSSDIENLGSLDALTSIIVPVRVTRTDTRKKRDVASCIGALLYAIGVAYNYICGDLQTRSASAVLRGFSHFSNCGSGRGFRVVPSSRRGCIGRCNDVRPRLNNEPYTTPTVISCSLCILSALGCIPTNIPGVPCVLAAASTIIGGFSLDVSTGVSWLGCGLSLVGGGLPAATCIIGVLKDCYGVGALGRRRKRAVEETVRDLVEAYYPIYHTMLVGAEILGDESWIEIEDSKWLSQVLRPALSDDSDLGIYISQAEFSSILSFAPPKGATNDMVKKMISRLNNTQYAWNSGILEPSDDLDIASYSIVQNSTKEVNIFNEKAKMKKFNSFVDAYTFASDDYSKIENFEEESGVCAVVRIRIEQELALTREAFLAKLEIENKESSSLEKIQVEIIIKEGNSGIISIHLFSISNVTLTGSLVNGDGGWTLSSSGSGAAEWLIVPYSEAAPTENQLYDVGGTFSYVVNGKEVSIPLLPSSITVMPDPSLRVHYFWEKYVIGDNPFTDEKEPSVPFSLAVAIQNAGYGVAMNLHITSGQPEIIENEKGLLVTFKIIGANVGREAVRPSLTVEFGDIPANRTKVARWWMICSLQGEFRNYSASFEYMNPLGDPKLSVLDELKIHELIRNVYIYQSDEDDGILDFLADDQNDLYEIPDSLYNSKTFEHYNVSLGEIISIQSIQIQGVMTQQVMVTANSSGWVYFRYNDTENIFHETKRAINFTKIQNNVNTDLPPENAWITRERPKNPGEITHFILHIFDYLEEAGEAVFTLNPCTSDCPTNEQPFEKPAPPPPPIDVEVTGIGSYWIAVSWKQLLTFITVEYNTITASGEGEKRNVTVGGSELNVNATDLMPGTTYQLNVVAISEGGLMSVPSISVTAFTLFSETPTPPKKLQVTGASFSWIHFTWTQSPMDTNITKYIILVSREDEQRNVTKEDTQTNANITDLEPGTEYTFRVVAIAIDGQSSIPSDLLTVSTSQTVPLVAPENITLESVGVSWIVLSWRHSSMDVVRYIVTVSESGREVNITVEGSESSANITNLTPETDYRLRITAVGKDGQKSPPSDVLATTTLFSAPLVPETIMIEAVGKTWITISWQQVVFVSQYILTLSGGSSVVSVSVSGSERQTNVSGLLPDTEYSVTVVVVDRNGQTSLPSATVAASTAQIVPLLAPDNFTLESVGVSWIVLSWRHSSMEVVRYIVKVSESSKEVNITVDGSESSANVTNLTPGTDYRLRITAVGKDGQTSPPSDVLATTTLFSAPLAPETIMIEAVGKTWITISWQQVVGVSQYILTVSGGSSVVSVSISGSERQIKVSGLLPDTEYSVTVVVVDRNGQTSLPSATVAASTAQIVPLLAPENLMLESVGVSWIVLSWRHSYMDIVRYIVSVRGAGQEANIIVEGKKIANVTGLSPGTDYQLRVTAVSSDGRMSPYSDVLNTTTLFAALLPPKNIAIASVGTSWMVISWQQNMVDNNIMRYVVIVSGHGGLNVTVDGNTTTVNVTSLQPDIEYSVSVIAIGPDEQISPPSVPIKQATTVPAPSAPDGLSIEGTGSSWIMFSWRQSASYRDILIYTIVIVGGGMEHNVSAIGSETSKNVTSLKFDTEYSLRIIALAVDGQRSQLSVEKTARTLLPPFDVWFVNDTPRIQRGIVYAEIMTNRPHVQLQCRLRGFERRHEDCSNGIFNRTDVPPGKYILRVIARNSAPTAEKKLLVNAIYLHRDAAYCVVYLINKGWRVEGHRFIIEFSTTGEASQFTCSLDRQEFACTSPLTLTNLPIGRHVFTLRPQGCSGFTRWKKVFHIT